MTKEEFERRITAVFEMAEKLSNASGAVEASAKTENDRGIAIAFYERLVEDFDARLEMLMDDEMRHSTPTKSGLKGGGIG